MAGTKRAIVVVDLAYGDCGKGLIVDALVRRHGAGLVVRFNGGPQAGHNVVTPDGRHHTFAQFGSGTFVDGVRTFLSRFMLIEPYALINEAAHLAEIGVSDAWDRLLIDARCPVISPAHQSANRLREIARGAGAHGTCGMGIGQTMQDLAEHPEVVLRAGELGDAQAVRRKLIAACDLKLRQLASVLGSCRDNPRAQPSLRTLTDRHWIDIAIENYRLVADRASILDDASADRLLRDMPCAIYEGAQGVLLDERFGFHPHTTWSTTTPANAEALLRAAGWVGERTTLGVLRTYFTRHGPGPLVTEDPALAALLPEAHNGDDGWQGRFRVGSFDLVAARYALTVAGRVDALAITHLDRLALLPPRICTSYRPDRPLTPGHDLLHQEELTRHLRRCSPVYEGIASDADRFLERISSALGRPIAATSDGPTCRHVRFDPQQQADGAPWSAWLTSPPPLE